MQIEEISLIRTLTVLKLWILKREIILKRERYMGRIWKLGVWLFWSNWALNLHFFFVLTFEKWQPDHICHPGVLSIADSNKQKWPKCPTFDHLGMGLSILRRWTVLEITIHHNKVWGGDGKSQKGDSLNILHRKKKFDRQKGFSRNLEIEYIKSGDGNPTKWDKAQNTKWAKTLQHLWAKPEPNKPKPKHLNPSRPNCWPNSVTIIAWRNQTAPSPPLPK